MSKTNPFMYHNLTFFVFDIILYAHVFYIIKNWFRFRFEPSQEPENSMSFIYSLFVNLSKKKDMLRT